MQRIEQKNAYVGPMQKQHELAILTLPETHAVSYTVVTEHHPSRGNRPCHPELRSSRPIERKAKELLFSSVECARLAAVSTVQSCFPTPH